MFWILCVMIALNGSLVWWARRTLRANRDAEQRFILETQEILRTTNDVVGQCCERLLKLEEWHRGSMIRTQ